MHNGMCSEKNVCYLYSSLIIAAIAELLQVLAANVFL